MPEAIHLNLDNAWPADVMCLPARDLREWGPRLRYAARGGIVKAFAREVAAPAAKFVLYGSGDFHYLAGVFLGRVDRPVRVVSFDNHPDWDVRPPRWACGAWVNRALELPQIRDVSVWGCGNFELKFPSRLFANRAALRAGRLRVFPWAERYPAAVGASYGCVSRENWRDRFEQFARDLNGSSLYVTVDLDCLDSAFAATNWEQGLFTPDDVAWALERLREFAPVVGGDVCGAYSQPRYARPIQKFIGGWDHPKLPPHDVAASRRLNVAALETIWPALTA